MCLVSTPKVQDTGTGTDKKPLPILTNPLLDGLSQSIRSLQIGRSNLVIPRTTASGVGIPTSAGGSGVGSSGGGSSSSAGSGGDVSSPSYYRDSSPTFASTKISAKREQIQ